VQGTHSSELEWRDGEQTTLNISVADAIARSVTSREAPNFGLDIVRNCIGRIQVEASVTIASVDGRLAVSAPHVVFEPAESGVARARIVRALGDLHGTYTPSVPPASNTLTALSIELVMHPDGRNTGSIMEVRGTDESASVATWD
jgi:hypothetical protein